MIKILILLTISINVLALQFEVYGPCLDQALVSQKVELSQDSNAGLVTISTLEALGIPFQGSERGMNSILNSPLGLDAMEVFSDTRMRSHGWCYSINGKGPSVYPDEVSVTNTDTLTWYYCYVEYDSGIWSNEYFPTNTQKPEQFCK